MSLTIQRRQFLIAAGVASAAAVVVRGVGVLGDEIDPVPFRMAFLSDTHIAADPSEMANGVNMAENLSRVVTDVLQRLPAGSHLVLNGDAARLDGQRGDYKTLVERLSPLIDAGFVLHITLGNHDDRHVMLESFQSQSKVDVVVQDKHVGILETPHVDFVLLDSLQQVNVVTGELGSEQLNWLERVLAARANRPLILIGHHNLQFEPHADGLAFSGLADTASLVPLMQKHANVTAYMFGHTHRWSIADLPVDRSSAARLVNLPATSYVFESGQPNGWVEASLSEKRAELTLHTIDPTHDKNGDRITVPLI